MSSLTRRASALVSRRHSPWAWLTGGLAVYATAFLAWTVSPLDVPTDARKIIADAAFLAPGLIVSILAWRAATAPDLSSRSRRAWLLLGFAFLAFWAGDAIYFWYDVVAQEPPFPSLADAAYLGYYPILLAGLLSFPRILTSGTQRLRFVLDVLTVSLGGAMVVWYLVLGPIAESDHSDLVASLISVAYPVGDLVLLLGLAVIVIRAPRELPHRALMFLLAGLLVSLVADLAYGVQNLDGTYEPGRWVDGLYIAAWAILGAGAYFGYERLNAVAPGKSSGVVGADGIPLVPYLAVALGYGLLVAAVRASWSPTVAGVIVGAGGLTALVVARQVIAVRENLRLVREQLMQRTDSRFRSLVQNASDLIIVLDRGFAVQYETPSVERVLGHRLGALRPAELATLVHPDDVKVVGALLVAASASTTALGAVEARLALAGGGWLHVEVSAINLLDDPQVSGVVVTVRDIDDRKRLEQKLAHEAHHDPLTGLANRRLLARAVEEALARARGASESVVLLFLDVDELKTINDSLGHDAGDRVLIEIGRRIRASTRSGDLAGRVGGDEFAVLLSSPGSEAAAASLAARILESLRVPFVLDGTEITLGASIGVAVSDHGAELGDELIRNADSAMYHAKSSGKGQAAFFTPGMLGPGKRPIRPGGRPRSPR